jgi:uncharacterized RDD family membrane protein YckC
VHLGDRALYLGIALLYFFLFEWAFTATIGKFVCGVRVVRKNGGRVGFGGAFVRTILRIIDQLPAFYIVGWISAMVTGNDDRARLGDLAGRTRVVRSTAVAAYAGQPQYQAAPVQPG